MALSGKGSAPKFKFSEVVLGLLSSDISDVETAYIVIHCLIFLLSCLIFFIRRNDKIVRFYVALMRIFNCIKANCVSVKHSVPYHCLMSSSLSLLMALK